MDLRLICTGHANDYQQEIVEQAKALDLGDRVVFAGVVPEGELEWLYRHTALVAIPTEYEAGSFPLIEAILLGAPVISSNVTSLPETIGDPRFTFNPNDVDTLSRLIVRMLTDPSFRAHNLANSTRRAQQLRSINSSASIYATYQAVLEQI